MDAWNKELKATTARLERTFDRGSSHFGVLPIGSVDLNWLYGHGVEALCDAALAAAGELDLGGQLGGIFLLPLEFMEYVARGRVPERFVIPGKSPAETRRIFQTVVRDMNAREMLYLWDFTPQDNELPVVYDSWELALQHNEPLEKLPTLH